VSELQTDDVTPALDGTLPTGDNDTDTSQYTIALIINGVEYAAINNQDGTWRLADGSIAALEEGFYDVIIIVTDEAGNETRTTLVNQIEINNSGFLIDSALEGIKYVSGQYSGYTDANGMFKYDKDANVTFYLSDESTGIVLGNGQTKIDPHNAKRKIITLFDLVGTQDETNQKVLNMGRLLQALDSDNDVSNGITLDARTKESIALPAHVDETKMQLVIGVGDNVGGIFRHEINLKRPPKYVKKYKFIANDGNASKSITVKHPYGGLIFLKSFDSSVTSDATATVDFAGVQQAVRFVLGETTESGWDAITNSPAPKAELESKHYIITVPRSNMASLSFAEVTTIAEQFDQMSQNAYDFYGYDRSCSEPFNEHTPPSCEAKKAHKNREVFDPHISVGAGHSGYPIMVMRWKPNNTTFPQDASNSFLLWHEMGHNMVESWLGISGAGEVANNVMALHQQKRFARPLRTASSIGAVDTILAKGQPWADGGNFGRLLMFHQLAKWIDANTMKRMAHPKQPILS